MMWPDRDISWDPLDLRMNSKWKKIILLIVGMKSLESKYFCEIRNSPSNSYNSARPATPTSSSSSKYYKISYSRVLTEPKNGGDEVVYHTKQRCLLSVLPGTFIWSSSRILNFTHLHKLSVYSKHHFWGVVKCFSSFTRHMGIYVNNWRINTLACVCLALQISLNVHRSTHKLPMKNKGRKKLKK